MLAIFLQFVEKNKTKIFDRNSIRWNFPAYLLFIIDNIHICVVTSRDHVSTPQ